MKKTFECEATLENLDKATAFVEGELEELGCGMKQMMQKGNLKGISRHWKLQKAVFKSCMIM